MPVFTCPSCKQFRNTFDKVGNICAKCAGQGIAKPATPQRTVMTPQGKPDTNPYPCVSCKKVIRPHEGQMLSTGVYCYDCLNTGKWLHTDSARRGRKIRTEVYKEGEKPRSHFGRG